MEDLDLYSFMENLFKRFVKVQRGTVAATTTGVAVTINPVDATRTTVRCASGRASNDNIVLTNSTTITVTSSVAGNVNWEVVDFGGGN